MAADKQQYTRDELIDKLQAMAEVLDRSPTVADVRDASDYPSVNQFLDEFESWNAAKQAAGLETFRKEGRGKTYSDAELIEKLQQLADDVDGFVTIRDVNKADNCPSAVTFQRHFGSWNAAKEAAGLETIGEDQTPVEYTDAELCALLRQLDGETDGPLTVKDIEDADEYPDHTTFERRFGSWNQAKQTAGLKPIEKGKTGRSPTYSDEELLNKLRQLNREIDEPLTKAKVDNAEGYPSASTCSRRFGSWTEAKRKAGVNGR